MLCSKCGTEIGSFKFCPECGTAAVALAPPQTKSKSESEAKFESDQRTARVVISLSVVVLIVLAAIAVMFSSNTPSTDSTTTPTPAPQPFEPVAPEVGKPTRHTGNVAHDRLVAYSVGEQALFLGKTAGEGCVGTDAFFMGMDREKDAFWSVRCANGESYSVEIHPDSTGSTQVLECSILKAVAGTDCFTKLKN